MRLTLALILALLPLAAQAQTQMIMGPVYGQIMAFPVPVNFMPGFENAKDGFYILELPPDGETVDNWTQLITMTSNEGLAQRADLATYMQFFKQGFGENCPDNFAAVDVEVPPFKGAEAQAAAWMGCGAVAGQSELLAIIVIQKAGNFYSLQWAERGPVRAAAPVPDWAVWDPRFMTLAQGRLCDRVEGEVYPYPSCAP